MAKNSNHRASERAGKIFERLRKTSSACAHNHQTTEEILREMHIGPIEHLLLWLSKTDYYVLSLSTYHTRLTLASLGMMVIFTSLLAFSSAFYAALSTLISPENSFRWLIALMLALIYAFGILIIDREIVGSITKKSLVIRFFFAIFIATAVSWPVKVKFFEGRIESEVNRMIEERNADKMQRIEELMATGEPERKTQLEEIKKRIDSYDKEIAILDEEIRRETEDVSRGRRCGPRCERFRAQKDEVMKKRISAEKELSRFATRSLPQDVRAEIAGLREQLKYEREHPDYDFLTKWEALGRIKKQSGPEYLVMSSFLLIFFMLLELVPLMLKWSIGKTEYHYYLESRANLNNQKIISLTNLFIEAMQKDKHAVLEMIPLEITDLIAMHIEDEAHATRSEKVDLAALSEVLRGKRDENDAPSSAAPDDDGGDDSADDDPDATVDEPSPRA